MADTTDWSNLTFGWGWLPGAGNDAQAKQNVFGTFKPAGFDTQYLNEAAKYAIMGNNTFRLPSVEEYEKVFQSFKDNPAEYYKNAIAATSKTMGHNQSLVDYIGGSGKNDSLDTGISRASAALQKFGQEAVDKGYLNADQVRSIAESPYSAAYSKQSGYNNPDLRGGGGLFNKVMNSIVSNPVTLFAVPLGAAALSGAFAGAGAGATGAAGAGEGAAFGMSDAMAAELGLSGGSAFEAGAAGDVLAGMGIEGAGSSAMDAGIGGINTSTGGSGIGSFDPSIVSAPGIDTSTLKGMEYLGGTGSLAEGTAGLTADQLATATALGEVGTNAASGLGYLGGSSSLPAGTAGITGVTGGATLTDVKDTLKKVNDAKKVVNAVTGGGAATVPKSGTGGIGSDALLAALLGGAIGGLTGEKGNVSKVGYQGGVPEFTAERVAGKGVTYTPKVAETTVPAAEGGLMSLYDASTPVVMMAKGGTAEVSEAAKALTPSLTQLLASAQEASKGRSSGDANGIAYLVSRGYSPTDASNLMSSGTDISKMAKGGISDLGSYTHAKGGRMLKGPGDGMSDSIPANIDGKRPARLATDEFVVSADVVSALGNGSSDAGAKVLYDMMDKVRKASYGRKKQINKINPRKYMPA